jgi:hypothetical protein
MFHLTLPLPISKNRRVKTVPRQVLKVDLVGKAYYTTKVLVRNTPEWANYKTTVCGRFLEAHYHMNRITLKEGERLVFDLTWYLKNDRTDCINFHDLLADAIEMATDINDKHFLFRDRWVHIDPEDPRVDVVIRKQRRA